MSPLYCLLTILRSTLGFLEQLSSKRSLTNLNRFFSLSSWSPALENDEVTASALVHGTKMWAFHNHVQLPAANLVKSDDKFYKQYPEPTTRVDRPKVHRLLDLVQQTIPFFNHVSYIRDLIFESAHQPLKCFCRVTIHWIFKSTQIIWH